MAYYVDASALVKLVVREPQTVALRKWLRADARVVLSSDVARTELIRAARRLDPRLATGARRVLEAFALIALDTATYERAALLDPDILRSLDALHIAAALSLGDDLEGVVTYDERMAAAAEANGIPTVAPS
ncbi:MAG TPA: type II toxin-antitoxin system VapC family toxin [Miltoncostaeales bacterium]|nr:type II toxin-antitoxin system VapC family toxin [Miltoncostaeales bacterium]